MSLPERLLEGMELPPSAASPSIVSNSASVRLDGEHQARADRLAVEDDRAGPAHAVLAAEMGSRELQVLPYEIREGPSWLRRTPLVACH